MRLEYNMEMRQTQKLLMTPQLRQAIKLLQLPVLELTQYLDQQYMENPLLELVESEEMEQPVAEQETEEEWADFDWDLCFNDTVELRQPVNREAKVGFEHYVGSSGDTLQQQLQKQLNLLRLSAKEKEIASYIIDSLDECGYLQLSCEDIASQLNVSRDQAERALEAVQGLEPVGVAARDLRECLLLQLGQCHDVPTHAQEIIYSHLSLLAKGRVPVLAEKLGAEISEVQRAIDFVRHLEPRPGLSVTDARDTVYVYPDVSVLDVAGEWVVLVNDSYSPRLRLNPLYRQLLQAAQGEEIRQFLREKYSSALWLLRAVEQRRSTLYKITEFLIFYQQEFFRQGVKALRPLRLKDVADALDIHESTVSRAVNGKYVQTPRGMYELRYFFSVNLETCDGWGISSTCVKKLLEDLVISEDKSHPLTDQELSDLLQQQGVKISRRTVAKYREELDIASSTLRRRWA